VARFSRPKSETGPSVPLNLFLWSLLVGAIAGLGAVAFRGLIGLVHNLLFLGKLSLVYDSNMHTPSSPWGPFVILIPVLGAVGVAFLVKNFAPEAKGHGVPEVMDAVYYEKGVIRPVVALIKSLASALCIGSGGSVGREGPIVQIGSSFGATLGQMLRMPVWMRITLIGAGAGAGIAATFNTPIGGILFALELILHEVSVRTIVPVAISTATATYIGQLFFGRQPSFVIPGFGMSYFHAENPFVLLCYAGLGVILGVASAAYIKSVYGAEDFFERHLKNYYARHAIGMLLVGIIMYLFAAKGGHYYVEGIGYATVQDVLAGVLSQPYFLALLFLSKALVTSVTLGSGGSGGIFSPSLYLGATLGGAFGIILHLLFPTLPIQAPAFAVAGMAGLVGGATGAPVTAVVMIFEMTLNYNVVIPMTVTVALSYAVRKLLSKESIYSAKLVRRGHTLPEALHADFRRMRKARQIMETAVVVMRATTPLEEALSSLEQGITTSLIVFEDDEAALGGFVPPEALVRASAKAGGHLTLNDISKTAYGTIGQDATLFDVMSKMRSDGVPIILVLRDTGNRVARNVVGFIGQQEVGRSVVETIDPFMH
jgi:CIC family chloride channel protein